MINGMLMMIPDGEYNHRRGQYYRIFEVNYDNFKLEKESLKKLRLEYDKFYAVTDEKFNQNELIEFIGSADALIVGLDLINEDVLRQCSNLKIISKYGVGLNNIDIEACKKRNVVIGWTGGVNKLSVAEMALGFMLMFARNLFIASNELKTGKWNKSAGFQLSGKTVGIIGLGHTGKELVRLLKPFDCQILANDVVDQTDYYSQNNIQEVSKDEIFKVSDFVTINTPFKEEFDLLTNTMATNLEIFVESLEIFVE